ncbi:MAG: hypothetical protein K2V38_28830, partial [Gemmataceae bacterium]|nr:hypothetical protein [Gemmataceae bacterium]
MSAPWKLRAPSANAGVLAEPDFNALPALIAANRRRLARAGVVVGGLPLPELRALARREALALTLPSPSPASGEGEGAAPLLLAGHQPELSHPGVWAKNFALHGLARRVGGIPLNLVVDNDTLKSASLRLPAFTSGDPRSVRLESLNFDAFAGETPYEDRAVRDPELFRTFPARAAPLWANWDHQPLLAEHWAHGDTIGHAFTRLRVERERAWGCENRELPVSRLAQTAAFGRFAGHILGDLARFRAAYNQAVAAYRQANGIRSKNHPVPDLADGEAPFWVRTREGRRQRATPGSDPRTLRPRALTLTLFARV